MIEFLAQMPTDTKIFSHNGSSEFGDNANSAEMADLAAPLWRMLLAHVVCGLLGRVFITRSAAGR